MPRVLAASNQDDGAAARVAFRVPSGSTCLGLRWRLATADDGPKAAVFSALIKARSLVAVGAGAVSWKLVSGRVVRFEIRSLEVTEARSAAAALGLQSSLGGPDRVCGHPVGRLPSD